MQRNEKNNYRWLVLFILLLIYFLVVIQRTAPGVITDQLMGEFGVSASALGMLTGIQFLAYAALQIPVGILTDKYGPANFLVFGAFLSGAGTLLYSISPNEAMIFLARLLVGGGDAMIWVNVVVVLSMWFKEKEFGSSLGWAGMSGTLGSMIATAPLTFWIAHSGWRLPFFSLGIALCVTTFLIYLILAKGPKTTGNYQNKTMSLQDVKGREQIQKKINLWDIVRSRQAWAVFFCHFGAIGTYVGFIGSWAFPYGITIYEMTRTDASQLVMLGLVGALIGAPLTGWISDRLQTRKIPYIAVHSLGCLCYGSLILFGGKPPFWMLIVLFLIMGYYNGSNVLTFAIIRSSFPPSAVGMLSGFANTGGFLSAMLLPGLFGKILDYSQTVGSVQTGFQLAFAIPTLFSLIGLMGGLAIKEKTKSSSVSIQVRKNSEEF